MLGIYLYLLCPGCCLPSSLSWIMCVMCRHSIDFSAAATKSVAYNVVSLLISCLCVVNRPAKMFLFDVVVVTNILQLLSYLLKDKIYCIKTWLLNRCPSIFHVNYHLVIPLENHVFKYDHMKTQTVRKVTNTQEHIRFVYIIYKFYCIYFFVNVSSNYDTL